MKRIRLKITEDFWIGLILIFFLVGLIGVVIFNIKTLGTMPLMIHTILMFPTFILGFMIIFPSLWYQLAMLLFLHVILPRYYHVLNFAKGLFTYDVVEFIRAISFLNIIFLIWGLFHYSDSVTSNPFYVYKRQRIGTIEWCRNILNEILENQLAAPGTFYSRIRYKHLPMYQEKLNQIMHEVLNDNYTSRKMLSDMGLNIEQKTKILDISEELNKEKLESGYLLAMLHQYFLHVDDFMVRMEKNSIFFSQWADMAVKEYPLDGPEAWQDVLRTYWPSH